MWAFAVISAIGYMLLTVAGFTEVTAGTIGVVAFSYVFSRVLSALSVVTFPKASNGGSAKAMEEGADRSARGILLAELLLVSVLLVVLFKYTGIAALVMGLAVGGITGDLAGYFLCLCELMILLTAVTAGRLWP